MRRLRRAPVPAVVVVLALGVGVNLAVFGVIHAALLRPLPHPDPDRLVAISSRHIESGREHLTAPLDFFDIERRASSLSRVAAYYPPGFTLTGGGQAERVSGARASSGIFDVFGVQPVLGRGFVPAEDRAGAAPVAVISHALWTRRYHGNRDAVGQAIVLSGRTYTLVGVLPEGFHSPAMWPRMPEVWVPLGLDPNVGRRDARMLRVIGRLRPDVSVDQARAELTLLAAGLAVEHPDTNAGTGASVAGLLEQMTRDVRPSLYALGAAVIALMLVACGNAAGLLIGGALARQHEFATRLALGASRARIVRQVVAENLVVGLLAAAAGFALAWWASDLLVGAATAAGVPRASEISIGPRTFAVGVVLSLACTIVCALVTALEATRAGDLRVVRGAGASTPRRGRGRAALIGLEAALSMALLVGAALLIRSFYALQLTDPGFDPARVVTTRLSAPSARYPAGPVLAGFYDRVVERVKALPGVERASVVDWLPVSGFGASVPFRLTLGGPTRSAGDAGRDPGGRAGLFPDDGHSGRRRTSVRSPRRGRRASRRRDQRKPGPRLLRLGESRRSTPDARPGRAAGGRDRRRRGRRARARPAASSRAGHLRAEGAAAVDAARDTRSRHPHERRPRGPGSGGPGGPARAGARHAARADPADGRRRRRSPGTPRLLRVGRGRLRAHGGAAGGVRHLRDRHVRGGPAPSRARCSPGPRCVPPRRPDARRRERAPRRP